MAINNLYDFYTQNGGQYNAWNSAQRMGDAGRAGIQNYTGTADQNNQLLKFLQTPQQPQSPPQGSPPPIQGQMGAISGNGGNTLPPPQMPTGGSTAPQSTPNPYVSQYQALLNPSSEEQTLQSQDIALQDSFRQGNQGIQDQTIPMGFITGQQQSLENRFHNAEIPLQQKLANAQQKRQASLDAVKFEMDRTDKEQARQDQLAQSKLDESYRQQVLNQKTPDTGFSLGQGETRYDSQGNVIASSPKTYAPSSSGTSGGSSGGSYYTPTQKQSLSQAGIDSSDSNASSYFLNTPKEFQDFWQRELAGSPSDQKYSADELQKYYTNWYNNVYSANKNGSSNWWE